MTRLMMPPLLLLALGACSTTMVKESAVQSALVDAGVSRAMAECMARPMAEQLSVRQLRNLERLAEVRRERVADLTLGELAERLRQTDPETTAVVTRASVGCMLRG